MRGVNRSVSLDATYQGMVNGGYGGELRCVALAKTELHRRRAASRCSARRLELDAQAMYRTHDTPTPPVDPHGEGGAPARGAAPGRRAACHAESVCGPRRAFSSRSDTEGEVDGGA
jgi:hypothetical protein